MIPSHSTLPLRQYPVLLFTILLLACALAACGGDETPAPAIAPTLTHTPIATETPATVPTDAPAEASADAPPAATSVAASANGSESITSTTTIEDSAQGMATPTPDARVPAYGYTVINTYPHDTGAYTQGLQYVDGVFYEGTGRHGQSSLRRVEIETGEVLQQHDLADDYFGEGIVVIDERIFQLTWQEKTAFLYDRDSFEELQQFTYQTEGWGLTFDGEYLIMSDGSNALYFRDPVTFDELGSVSVTYLGAPLSRLNELEYIDGLVWANVYQTNFIVQINPETGIVVGVIDLSGILENVEVTEPVDVLNGIAWDAEEERLFVTGKWWPAVFEITLHQIGWAE